MFIYRSMSTYGYIIITKPRCTFTRTFNIFTSDCNNNITFGG